MKLDDYRMSDNVRQAGRSGGGGGFGGRGGGIFGLLFGLVLSRFGIGGVLILALGYCALSTFGGGGGIGLSGPGTAVAPHQSRTGGQSSQQVCTTEPERQFSCQVLASTEDTWAKLFQARGQTYQAPGFAFYNVDADSGCGEAQAAMGPFYCPSDQSIYIDTSFYDELRTKFGAAGDFAQAYVIAHEVGHHIQGLTGVLADARRQQGRLRAAEGNAVQVRVELQADCYAGVWAAQNRARLEPGDIQEGMTAAAAIGDDTLQRQAQGRVSPESFTHGTSEQRMQWLRRGLETGDPAACDTFAAGV